MKKLILVFVIFMVATSAFAYKLNPPYPYNNSDVFQQYEAATQGVVHVQGGGHIVEAYFMPEDYSENYTLWKVEIQWNPHTERFEETNFEEACMLAKKEPGSRVMGAFLHENEYGKPLHSQHPDDSTVITQYYNGHREIVIRYEYDVTISDYPFYTWEEID